jgi:hypothetical protein
MRPPAREELGLGNQHLKLALDWIEKIKATDISL